MSQPKLTPLSVEEAAAAREFFAQAHPDVLQRFVGWMVKSGEFSGKVAEDIRQFTAMWRGGANERGA